jgi:FlaA1/EpsC-like NDP-sugar epimerase
MTRTPTSSEIETGTLDIGGIEFRCRDLTTRSEWLPLTVRTDVVALGPCVVIGGAGSIGGVLSHMLAAWRIPLLIADLDEDRLSTISTDLGDAATYRLLDVCDPEQVSATIEAARPTTIFNLAARKHVRFLEGAARLGHMTNAVGTLHVLEAAAQLSNGCRVMLSSSDKAGVPSNLVGLTKRTAEDLIGGFNDEGLDARGIRLPNVLGTAGSVVHHYVRESAKGRPLDVWSTDMSRYFCCVHEAAQALIAGALDGSDRALRIFDVGPSIPIVTLAESVSATLRRLGRPSQVVVSERFAPVHARHETLAGPDELWEPPSVPPGLGTLERTFPPRDATREAVLSLAASGLSDDGIEAALWEMHSTTASQVP